MGDDSCPLPPGAARCPRRRAEAQHHQRYPQPVRGRRPQWLAASPFCLLATTGADGTGDVSPRETRPASPSCSTTRRSRSPSGREPAGRRLANLLANPHVGLLFLIPGRRHVADQRPRRARERRAVLRRLGSRAAGPSRARRPCRGGLLPLRQGVPPVRPVAAGDLGARTRSVPRVMARALEGRAAGTSTAAGLRRSLSPPPPRRPGPCGLRWVRDRSDLVAVVSSPGGRAPAAWPGARRAARRRLPPGRRRGR